MPDVYYSSHCEAVESIMQRYRSRPVHLIICIFTVTIIYLTHHGQMTIFGVKVDCPGSSSAV
ncbi:unnamed protein product [Callosobruchus maculatus]|uniref:Uncharacterized protein n=1 Tax=Callosobruchus maculatus TaxID=64391 RepID=A0A653CX50_CALMS|nr:unnamed protein product [Callosobruchus maculatus]